MNHYDSPFWEAMGIGACVLVLFRAILYWWSYRP